MRERAATGLILIALAMLPVNTAAAQSMPGPGMNTLQQRRQESEEFRRQYEAASPEERERLRAQRRAERFGDRPAKLIELHGPLPLPVQVANPAPAAIVAGPPAGAACKPNEECSLEFKPRTPQVLIVTAVWGASKVQCDDLTTATPGNGAPINVAWRCERQLLLQGTGAGYAGYLAPR